MSLVVCRIMVTGGDAEQTFAGTCNIRCQSLWKDGDSM